MRTPILDSKSLIAGQDSAEEMNSLRMQVKPVIEKEGGKIDDKMRRNLGHT